MTALGLLVSIDIVNMGRSANGQKCLSAEEIKKMAEEAGLKDVAEKIDTNGSPWEALCVVRRHI